MREVVMRFVARVVEQHGLAGESTLEVGSYDVNGSVRPLFRGPYLGVDMRPGPGVDRVAQAAALPFEGGTFGVVVSTETLEHDATFWRSVPEMVRVLRPGGFLILTAAGLGFPKHDYPSDYWRFTPEAFRSLMEGAGIDVLEAIEDVPEAGVFAIGRRRP